MPAETMRAKYLNKTARRRTVRPDGGSYRELRKMRGGKQRAKIVQMSLLIIVGVGLAFMIYTFFIRA
jgi:hypothetical protein